MKNEKNDHLMQLIYELKKNNDPPNLERYKELLKLENITSSTLIKGFTFIDRVNLFCEHISEVNKKSIIHILKITQRKGIKI